MASVNPTHYDSYRAIKSQSRCACELLGLPDGSSKTYCLGLLPEEAMHENITTAERMQEYHKGS